jgi:hypothetical protein
MSTPGATHDECMQCGALYPVGNCRPLQEHEAETGHAGWMDVIVNPREWKRIIETVEGSCLT